MSPPDSRRVELSSVEISQDGEGFVLGFVASNQDVHKLELPRWTIHQLMRMLPRLDATLSEGHSQSHADLVAYPVVHWSVEATGADHTVALSVRDARQIESAFLLEAGDASDIQAALADALRQAAAARGSSLRRAS